MLLENLALKLEDIPVGCRSCSVHEFNKRREELGEFNNLYRQARLYDDKFFEYLRMTKESFDLLLHKLEDKLTKVTTNFKEPISAEQRLVITLR